MQLVKSWFLSVWGFFDPLYYELTRLQRVPDERDRNAFRVRLMTYRGRPIRLADGTIVKRGVRVLKVHLHNIALLQDMRHIYGDVARARWLYRHVQQSMPGLCRFLQQHPQFRHVDGMIGITMLNRGCRSLGFQPIPLNNPLYKTYKWVTLLPIFLLSADRPWQTWRKHEPVYLYMSIPDLLARYDQPLQS